MRRCKEPTTKTQYRAFRAESFAECWASQHGWRTIARNYRARGTEVDLLLGRNQRLLIVEVKGRSRPPRNLHEWQNLVNRRKTQALSRGVDHLLHRIRPVWQPHSWQAVLWLIHVREDDCCFFKQAVIDLHR